MTYDPHAICDPCWFDEHDRCYGCRCVDDRHAQTPQIATDPATDSTRNEDT